jgi:hypothetical protein
MPGLCSALEQTLERAQLAREVLPDPDPEDRLEDSRFHPTSPISPRC